MDGRRFCSSLRPTLELAYGQFCIYAKTPIIEKWAEKRFGETPTDPYLSQTPIDDVATQPTNSNLPVPQQPIQIGPYWGYRSEFGTDSPMLKILSAGFDCIDSVEIIIDGKHLIATVIADQNDPHYIQQIFPFEGSTGASCNYLIGNEVVKPLQYFSVPRTTYGMNVPPQPPFEWCYQNSDKTWKPCN